jgi:DNA-directed RNA polymerase subunit RPC12/RpoP
MKCLSCSREVDENATACQYCGTAVLSPQALKTEQENNSASIQCELCGQQVSQGASYTWVGGKIAAVREVERRRETTRTVITHLISYNHITSIPTGFCPECYQQRIDKMKLVTYVILSIVVLVPLAAFLLLGLNPNTSALAIFLSAVVIFMGLPFLDAFKIYLGKDKNKILERLLRRYANTKLKKLELDRLWNQRDYLELIASGRVNDLKLNKA